MPKAVKSKRNKTRKTNKPLVDLARFDWKIALITTGFLIAAIATIYFAFSRAATTDQVTVGIIKTQYTYPANAIFVSTKDGDNTKSGTSTSPLKTLQAAVDKAPAGGTIVMRGGVYREELKTLAKALTIQPYPNEEVWLDGSDVVTGWVQDGNIWRKDNWSVATSLCPNNACFDQNLVTSANPAGGLPDMVYVDNVQLKQVLTKAEVVTGTFYVDRANSKLYIGTSPTLKTVEASTRKQAIMYYSAATAGSKLRGIGVRRYAANVYFTSKPGQIEVSNGAKSIEFDNMTFIESSANGIFMTGSSTDRASNITIRNSIFANNGASGVSGNYLDAFTMDNNVVYNNNTEKVQWDGEYGSYAGTKIARMTNSTIKYNLFQNNFGTGYWCDLDCSDNKILGNMARGNTTHGIFYEVSYNATIASNVSYNNGEWGYKINGRNIYVYNNTAYNNKSDNFFIYDDPRLPSQNVAIENNLSAAGPSTNSASHLMNIRTNIAGTSAVTALDGNLYYRPNTTAPKYVLGWQGTTPAINYTTLDATLRSQTGREGKSTLVEGVAITKVFTDPTNHNFKLAAGSAAILSSNPLPAIPAAVLSRPVGSIVNRGALTWKNGQSNTLATSTPDNPTPTITAAPPTITAAPPSITAAPPTITTVPPTVTVAPPTVTAAPPTVTPTPTPTSLAKPSGFVTGLAQNFLSFDLGLRWNAVRGATSYKITPLNRPTILTASSSYTDPAIAIGNSYTYSIVASNGSLNSTPAVVQIRTGCAWWIFGCTATIVSSQ